MRKILVIRESGEGSRILAENGFEVINLPVIETRASDDLSDFEARLDKIENYDGIFLTSRVAAQILAEKLRERDKNFKGKIYILGKSGFDLLKSENLELIFDETANTAREFLEKLAPEQLKKKRFLFVRGARSLRVVPDFLEKRAAVDETIVYRTEKIVVEADKIKAIGEQLKNGEIAAACFFSPSAAESFLEQFGAESLHQTRIATIGKTTAEFLEKRNLPVDFVSSKSSAEVFANELTIFLNNKN